MPDQFKTGDVVVLKSGGPKMTVTDVGVNFAGNPKVWCYWLEESKKLTGSFDPTSVKHVR
jgi:uncharacterized protein YodC (DUF2158 family)